jgi:hypothetical protein
MDCEPASGRQNRYNQTPGQLAQLASCPASVTRWLILRRLSEVALAALIFFRLFGLFLIVWGVRQFCLSLWDSTD